MSRVCECVKIKTSKYLKFLGAAQSDFNEMKLFNNKFARAMFVSSVSMPGENSGRG